MLRRTVFGEVRQPAVAGLFYPEQPAALRGLVEGFLSGAEQPQRAPKALVAPHAGFEYSGPIAGAAFRQLLPARDVIRRVVVAGPSHRVPFQGIALSSARRFATPLGEVPVDEDAQARIGAHPDVVVLDLAHAGEHCIETHLPFLQLVLSRFELVPLVFGQTDSRHLARVFETLWGGPETLLCVSSDLSHYLPCEEARTRDAETTRAIEALDPDALEEDQACGRTGLQALLLCTRRHGLQAVTLAQRNSGDTAGSRDRVVGYGAYAFV